MKVSVILEKKNQTKTAKGIYKVSSLPYDFYPKYEKSIRLVIDLIIKHFGNCTKKSTYLEA